MKHLIIRAIPAISAFVFLAACGDAGSDEPDTTPDTMNVEDGATDGSSGDPVGSCLPPSEYVRCIEDNHERCEAEGSDSPSDLAACIDESCGAPSGSEECDDTKSGDGGLSDQPLPGPSYVGPACNLPSTYFECVRGDAAECEALYESPELMNECVEGHCGPTPECEGDCPSLAEYRECFEDAVLTCDTLTDDGEYWLDTECVEEACGEQPECALEANPE